MDYKQFGDSIYARFNRGDEIISGIMGICRKLSNQFDFGSEYVEEEIKNFGKFVMCLELTPEHITGKIINES